MKPGRLLAIGTFAALALSAVPAGAGLSVGFDLPDAAVTIGPGGQLVAVQGSSPLTVSILDDGQSPPEIDSVSVPSGLDPTFLLAAQVFKESGDWTATGTLAFGDVNGRLGNPKVLAWFRGTVVAVNSSGLVISGPLSTQVPGPTDAILAGTGTCWEFAGDGGAAGADGDPGTATIPAGRGGYDYGQLTLTVPDASGSLDSIFSADDEAVFSGEITGSIVPAPGALPLAAAGIAVVGWLRRRAG